MAQPTKADDQKQQQQPTTELEKAQAKKIGKLEGKLRRALWAQYVMCKREINPIGQYALPNHVTTKQLEKATKAAKEEYDRIKERETKIICM